MNKFDCAYPVKIFFENINRDMGKYISANIPEAITLGLINEIYIIDKGSKITTPAQICKHFNSIDQTYYYQVSLSAAFCQFVWIICDLTIKTLDYNICNYVSAECRGDINTLIKENEKLLNMPKEKVAKFLIETGIKADVEKFLSQISRSNEMLKDSNFQEKIDSETTLAFSLLSNDIPLKLEDFNKLDTKNGYAEVATGAFVKAISFALHHELSHFVLKHFDNPTQEESDETDADFNAQWTMQNDLPEEEQFTANVGILCLMFALLFMDPKMKRIEGDIHPREDIRIFKAYDTIYPQNPKYGILVTYLFHIWNRIMRAPGFPEVKLYDPNAVETIRTYMSNYQPD